ASVNWLCRTDFNLLHIVLPLGISFFTFQQISFLVDAYRGEVPRCGFLLYASYVCYFPQLIAGPIVTHDELIPQFMDTGKKRLDWENLAKGIYIFTLGLSKKVLLADVFGRAVDWGFAHYDDIHSELAFFVMLAYTFQIYFDFSGYCDMAAGIAKMMNIDLPVNFNSPYKALTITEFWDRWHCTLTRFLKKYVYIPLGGNRKGELQTYLNILIVFFISGFWHGAGLNFIVWGFCHGVFVILTRRYKSFFEKLHPVLSYLMTFVFLTVTWVFFRAESFAQAAKILRRVAVFHFQELPDEFINCFQMPGFAFLVKNSRAVFNLSPFYSVLIPVYFVLAVLIVLGTRNVQERAERFAPTKTRLCAVVVLLLLCLNCFSAISPFLYFNF
ncbi:MAG: MBOAT family protein, partial [Treponema sp.]|nr:MBOAT family protein [Treponema sp.]